MRVVLSSIFRDSTSYLPRYFGQVDALREHIDVDLVLTEGDSADHTLDMIRVISYKNTWLTKFDHGGPRFGSVDHPTRWAQIAQVVRHTISTVPDPSFFDVFVWVESDLIWTPEAMLDLIKADRPVTPMVLAAGQDRFYDTWGHRQDGEMFTGAPPYLPHPPGHPIRYVRLDSCGSCFVVPASDFHFVREWDGVWPFACGGQLWLDTESVIHHP